MGISEDYVGTLAAQLPSDWSARPLRDLVVRGRQVDPHRYPSGRIKYVDVSGVSSARLRIVSWSEYKGEDAPSRARKLIQSGDVLFATVRPSLKRVAIVPVELDGEIASTAFCVVRANAELADPLFLFFALSSDDFVARVAERERGSSYPAVTDSDVLGTTLPVPPLIEQRAIAHVLSTVQRAREATEAVIAAARELKRSLMHELFTHGARPGPSETRRTPFGEVPDYWRATTLEDCAFVQTGVAKGRRINGDEAVTVPYLRVANVQDGYLDLREIKGITIRRSEVERYRLRDGDVLLTEGGDFDKLGRGCIWMGQVPGCVHQNHIFAVRARPDQAVPEYLAYLMQSSYGKAYFLTVAHRTTHLACINSTKLRQFPVPLPPLDEQKRIATVLGAVDRKIEAEEKRRAALEKLSGSLLRDLMSGRVRLDPAGLPGEVT